MSDQSKLTVVDVLGEEGLVCAMPGCGRRLRPGARAFINPLVVGVEGPPIGVCVSHGPHPLLVEADARVGRQAFKALAEVALGKHEGRGDWRAAERSPLPGLRRRAAARLARDAAVLLAACALGAAGSGVAFYFASWVLGAIG